MEEGAVERIWQEGQKARGLLAWSLLQVSGESCRDCPGAVGGNCKGGGADQSGIRTTSSSLNSRCFLVGGKRGQKRCKWRTCSR